MRVLIVEDDFISRNLMQKFLSDYGDCDVAVNGREALVAFNLASREGRPYDLLTLDIMMPEMDGQQVLREIRTLEESRGILGPGGVKIVMTTALSDSNNILTSFKEQCQAFLVKPISRDNLLKTLRALGLIP